MFIENLIDNIQAFVSSSIEIISEVIKLKRAKIAFIISTKDWNSFVEEYGKIFFFSKNEELEDVNPFYSRGCEDGIIFLVLNNKCAYIPYYEYYEGKLQEFFGDNLIEYVPGNRFRPGDIVLIDGEQTGTVICKYSSERFEIMLNEFGDIFPPTSRGKVFVKFLKIKNREYSSIIRHENRLKLIQRRAQRLK